MKPLIECRLYTFIDTAYLHGREPASLAQQLCDGGSDLIQLRAKNSTREDVLRLAEIIAPILQRAGVGLVINDYLDVAQQIGADLCHLGQEDFFDAGYTHVSQLPCSSRSNEAHSSNLKSQIKNDEIDQSPLASVATKPGIGLSTHTPDQALRAIAADPSYIAVGPVFATPTKPTARAVTLDYVRWAAANVKIPWFAIGGINLANLNQVVAAGARRICVVSAILNAPDVTAVCKEFRKRLG